VTEGDIIIGAQHCRNKIEITEITITEIRVAFSIPVICLLYDAENWEKASCEGVRSRCIMFSWAPKLFLK
jgi:hypothetical protein